MRFHIDPVRYFHGQLDNFLQLDTRHLVSGDQDLKAATDAKSIAAFLDKRRLDVLRDGYAPDLPDIVPQLTFKPILPRERLRIWAEVDTLLERASTIAVIGYSFAQVDEHFNDLLRKSASKAQVVVASPRHQVAWHNASRLVCIKANAQDLDERDLAKRLRP